MNQSQRAALKAAIDATPALAALWADGSTGALRDEVNRPSIAGDIDATRDGITRSVVSRKVAGKIAARIDTLRARAIAVASKAADPMTADLAALEARLVDLHNAAIAIDRLPSFTMTDANVRAFVTQMLDDLRTEGAITAGDKTAFLSIGRGMISLVESIGGVGTRAGEDEIIAAMKGL